MKVNCVGDRAANDDDCESPECFECYYCIGKSALERTRLSILYYKVSGSFSQLFLLLLLLFIYW